MKTTYIAMKKIGLSFLTCLFFVLVANAQRSGSSGNNNNRSSSPSPAPSPAPSPSRPASVGIAPSRPAFNQPARSGYQQPSQNNNGVRSSYGYTQRQGVSVNQPNNTYQQRVGVTTYPGNNNRQGVSTYSGNNNFNNGTTQRQGVIGYNNGNNAYGQRVGFTTSGYHSDGSYRRDYWGNHDYYHYNHGYYATYYQPRLGFSCYTLPYGYYPFYWGDYQYYYSDGLFYQYTNEQYTVVEPPIGAEVTTLPSNAQSIVINGQQYYEAGGVYYQPYTKDNGTSVYVVAGKDGELNTSAIAANEQPRAPQIGDLVNQLPPNCRKVTVNGQRLFVSIEGIYYQEKVDENGIKFYKIVGLPSDDPDQN